MNFKIARYLIVCLLILIVVLGLNKLIDFMTIKVYKYPTPGPSYLSLSNAISGYKNGEIPVVDLSTVTTFSSDQVYIFGPYAEPSQIRAVAGRSSRDSCFTTIESSDGLTLLVFTKDKRAVGCMEFPRNEADFSALESYESGFSVQEARFIVDEKGNMVWIGNK